MSDHKPDGKFMCQDCGDPSPCQSRKNRLRAQYPDPVKLFMEVDLDFRAASLSVEMSSQPFDVVWDRFAGWAVPANGPAARP